MLDVRIVNAWLIDGCGVPGRAGELGIRDGRIAAVDTVVPGAVRTTIDARGQVVCPGFIDLHTHCLAGRCENYLQMGVTLMVGGNCGFAPLDTAAVAAGCAGTCGPNLALLAGHNTIRLHAMGNVNRQPGVAELDRMRRHVAQAMAAGAVGFSTGLTYVPGNFADTAEVVALARVAADAGGYYTSHMRNEQEGLLDSIRETIEIGQSAGLPAHISHIKQVGMRYWGRSREAVNLLDTAIARGIDITQDQYPYTASCGRIFLLLPAWAQEGGPDDMLARLADPRRRSEMKDALRNRMADVYGADGDRVVLSSAPEPGLAGRSLAGLARDAGLANDPEGLAETVLALTARFPGQGQIYCVFHGMGEDDVLHFMRHPRTAIGSDGWVPRPDDTKPHPRLFGTMPRVLGHYVREAAVFPIEEAVRRMTGLPARRLGLTDRGCLQPGAWADLVVFDPAQVADRATFEDPVQASIGIQQVLVNGVVTIDQGRHTGALPGVFVSRPGAGAR